MKQILILLITLALCSCGTFKKTLHKTTTEEKTTTDLAAVSSETTAINIATVDTRTTTEEIDTNLVTKKAVITATGTVEDLMHGGVIHSEDSEQIIDVKINPKTGEITASSIKKEQSIPVTKKRTIIDNIKQNEKIDQGEKTDLKLHQEENKKNSTEDLDKSRKNGTNIYLLGVLSCLGVFVLIWFIILYLKKKKETVKQITGL